MLVIVVYSLLTTPETPMVFRMMKEPPKFDTGTHKPLPSIVKRKSNLLDWWIYQAGKGCGESGCISLTVGTAWNQRSQWKESSGRTGGSLRPNTTYTIDFADAIVDNNEGNPLGNYAFTFSTGTTIDTMEVSGTVLSASDLEPVKNIQVGLHSDLSDSAFMKKPFDRVSRTDDQSRTLFHSRYCTQVLN